MRKLPLLMLAAVLVIGLAPNAGAMTRKAANRVDHVKYYTTCATCPRGVAESTYTVYDGGNVFCNDRKTIGRAKNRVGWFLFSFWQRGRMCFDPPHQKKSMYWDAGSGTGTQMWNEWQEDPALREIHPSGSKCHDAKYGTVRCYRRSEFVFKASYQAWTFTGNDWVSQAFWTDGGYTHGHS